MKRIVGSDRKRNDIAGVWSQRLRIDPFPPFSARSPSTPTTTKYSLATGDLVKIDYTDNTTDIDFLEYDRLGNLKEVRDATGVRTFAYDKAQLTAENLPEWYNHLVLTSDHHTSTSTSANTVKGRYDRWKLGTSTDLDKEMSVVYGYDNFGRIDGVTTDYRAQGARSALNVPASYQYEPSSSLWRTLTQADATFGNFTLTRVFEPSRDVLLSITSAHSAPTTGTVATFGYGTDDAGRREWATQAGMAFGDVDPATYYRYGYNAANELESATGYRGTNAAATTDPLPGRGFGFTYDTAGNRKTASVSGDSVTYRDDAGGAGIPGANNLNQPRSRGTLKTRVSGSAAVGATVTVGGAATSRSDRYWDAALPNYAQYTSVSINATLSGSSPENGSVQALTRPEDETLTYDADGNLTSDSQWSYEWDAEDRLTRMVRRAVGDLPGLGWTSNPPKRELLFTYDYLGRRVRKISKLDDVVVSDRKFIYQGWSLIAELDTATNKIVRSYAWGLDIDSSLGGTGGVGGLVLETLHTDTMLTAYHVSYDGNGNVTALVNRANGAVAAAYEYGPFGENVRAEVFDAALAAAGQPFRFSTKFTDEETGLIYYGYRYYDPSLGRFINRDPIGEAGGNNLYGFVGNSPVNLIDVLGLNSPYDSPYKTGPVTNPYDLISSLLRLLGLQNSSGGWAEDEEQIFHVPERFGQSNLKQDSTGSYPQTVKRGLPATRTLTITTDTDSGASPWRSRSMTRMTCRWSSCLRSCRTFPRNLRQKSRRCGRRIR